MATKLGEYRVAKANGTTAQVPLYKPDDLAYSDVRLYFGSQTAALPLADPSDATHDDVRYQTSRGIKSPNVPTQKTQNFSSNGSSFDTGSVQKLTLNDSAFSTIDVNLKGAGGGDGEFVGALGGEITATVDIGNATDLYIYVGKRGESPPNDGQTGAGGFGAHFGGEGGFDTDHPSGGGGGSTELRVGSDTDSAAVISAGGGQGSSADAARGGVGGDHATEGGDIDKQNRLDGTGLVIDSSRVLSSSIVTGGGASNKQDGSATITFTD